MQETGRMQACEAVSGNQDKAKNIISHLKEWNTSGNGSGYERVGDFINARLNDSGDQ